MASASSFRARLDRLSQSMTTELRGVIADRPVSDEELADIAANNPQLSRRGIALLITQTAMTEQEWLISVKA